MPRMKKEQYVIAKMHLSFNGAHPFTPIVTGKVINVSVKSGRRFIQIKITKVKTKSKRWKQHPALKSGKTVLVDEEILKWYKR